MGIVVMQGNSLSQENKLSIQFPRGLHEDMVFWRQSGNMEHSFKMKTANLPKDFD